MMGDSNRNEENADQFEKQDIFLEETKAEKFFRKWAPPLVLLGACFWGAFQGVFLAYYSLNGRFIIHIVEEHFPGMILVPLSALMALCIVFLLRWTAGPLELSVGGVQLKGASGPITLWIFCFLSIIFSIWLLWPLKSSPGT